MGFLAAGELVVETEEDWFVGTAELTGDALIVRSGYAGRLVVLPHEAMVRVVPAAEWPQLQEPTRPSDGGLRTRLGTRVVFGTSDRVYRPNVARPPLYERAMRLERSGSAPASVAAPLTHGVGGASGAFLERWLRSLPGMEHSARLNALSRRPW